MTRWKTVVGSIAAGMALAFSPLAGTAVRASQAGSGGALSPAYLDQLLAPVALYPDALLAQVLLCSGNARKAGELAAWLKRNPHLKGSELQQAVQDSGFEPSFVALAPFPQVVELMAGNLTWTSQLGGAFAVDRGAVFTGKAAANLVQILVLEAILVPLSAVLFDYDLVAVAGEMLLLVVLHTVALVEMGTLFAAIAARLGRGEALLAILLLPASTPVFLSAVLSTQHVLAGEGLAPARSWLLVTAGLDVLYFLLAMLTFEFVLDE